MIKRAFPMLASTASNTSTLTLPFGVSDKSDTTEQTTSADQIKDDHADRILPVGKRRDAQAPISTATKSVKGLRRRPVPHSNTRIGTEPPEKKLPMVASSGPATQTEDDLDIEIYATAEVSDDLCQELLTNAVCLERMNNKGKLEKVYIIRTKTAFAMNEGDNTFTWICTRFDLLHKKREANGEIKVEIQTTDDLGTTNKQVPAEYFTKANLKELSKYGILVNPGYELLVSMYLTKVMSMMHTESAQQ